MRKRPIGVSILAVLYIIGGIGVLGIQLFMGGARAKAFNLIGISSISAVISILFLGILGLAA
jgi:hypothetical protein